MKLFINDLLFKGFHTFVEQKDFQSMTFIESVGSKTKILKHNEIFFCQYLNSFFGKFNFGIKPIKMIDKLTITDSNYLSIFLKSESIRKSLDSKTLKTISYKGTNYFINYLKKDFEIVEPDFTFYYNSNFMTISYTQHTHPQRTIFIYSTENYSTTKTQIAPKIDSFNVDYLKKPTRLASQ